RAFLVKSGISLFLRVVRMLTILRISIGIVRILALHLLHTRMVLIIPIHQGENSKISASIITDITSRLQFFHIIEHHGGTGGQTILVDGQRIADRLRLYNPAAYHFLTTNPIHFQYIENGVSLLAREPVIKLGEDNQMIQFRFNNNDRAPELM